ncbi:MAG: hypothetical protein ACYDB7_02635 [Mycobacteriales bacterium]
MPIKVISDVLGHAPSAFTNDVYTTVAGEHAELTGPRPADRT